MARVSGAISITTGSYNVVARVRDESGETRPLELSEAGQRAANSIPRNRFTNLGMAGGRYVSRRTAGGCAARLVHRGLQAWGAAIFSAKRAVKAGVQGLLRPFEARLHDASSANGRHAPIFIVGPPRTGSTLLYQLLVRRYRCCYFSNLLNAFPHTPLAIAKLCKPFGGFDPAADFSSEYGNTRGWRAPSQGRELWAAFLPESPNAVEPETVASEVKRRINDSVRGLQRVCGRPFVNKWPPNSVRVRLLAEIFPDALFVRISRAVEPTVTSILRGRQELCQHGSGWFSVKPQGYQEIMQERGPEEQAAWQVGAIERAIDAASDAVGAQRFFGAHYEELTSRPREVLNAIAAFYERNTGLLLEQRVEVPSEFAPRRQQAG